MRARVTKINGIAIGVVLACAALNLRAQTTNVWINFADGEWQDPFNWSLHIPAPSDWIYITNGESKTVFIDTTTAQGFSNSLTVARVTVGAPKGSVNTLALTDAGPTVPLHIQGELDLAAGGELTQTNSRILVDGLAHVGSSGAATYSMLSGFAQFGSMNVGEDSAQGALNLTGGSILIPTGGLRIAAGPQSFGTVTMGGGTLTLNSNALVVGDAGTGQFALFNGSVQAPALQLGNTNGSAGTLLVGGGLLRLSQSLTVGTTRSGPGTVSLIRGAILASNTAGTARIELVNGSVTLGEGTMQANSLLLEAFDGGLTNIGGLLQLGTAQVTGGTLALLGGTNTFSGGLSLGGGATGIIPTLAIANARVDLGSDLVVAGDPASIGIVNISGNATVNATNGTVSIGSGGFGELKIFDGDVTLAHVLLGGTGPTSEGTLELAGGHLKVLSSLSANLIIVDGGDLDGSGGTIIIGQAHNATVSVSSGNVGDINTMYVGYTAGFTGTYAQSGGFVGVTNALIVGDCISGALGVGSVIGGTLCVTNAAHNAVMDLRNGNFQLGSGGTLIVDVLILTNSCGHFINSGGTLIAGSIVLEPDLDADGDGMSNTNEFLAGTGMFEPTSNLRIVNVAQEGSDVRVTWTTIGGRSYVLQAAPNLVNGLSTPFTDLSPVVVAAGVGPGTANYLHAGTINGAPAKFYRVRTPALLSADNASDPAYGGTWTTGQNGGGGFGAWSLSTSGGGSGGFFISDSSENGSGASGNINTAGDQAWGIFANGGALSEAVRTLNAPLASGQMVKLELDTGFINTAAQNGGSIGAGKVGFGLRNGAVDLFELYFLGGDTQYRIHDASGTARATSISFTDGGLQVEFTLTSATTYSVTITPNGGSPSTFTGTLAAAGTLGTVRCFNYSAGVNSPHDAYFNSLQVGK